MAIDDKASIAWARVIRGISSTAKVVRPFAIAGSRAFGSSSGRRKPNTTAPDFYGAHRLGNNLFAESVVALDINTGKRVWHFQTVHHGLWDYDNPAAPNLLDITVNGTRERFQKSLAAVVDAGACPMQPTTVIDLTADEPILVRLGRGDPSLLGLQPHD